MPRFRPRFSLFAALLLMTIAGIAIVIVLLWQEVGPLRAQVRDLRAELGRLTIDDPKQAAAIQGKTMEGDYWRWRVYLPPGVTYQMCVYSGMIPPHKYPEEREWFETVKREGSGNVVPCEAGEFAVEARLLREAGRWSLRTSQGTTSAWRATLIDGDWLSERGGRGAESSLASDRQAKFRPGERIRLLVMRKPVVSQGGNTRVMGPAAGLAEGIAIWIEPLRQSSQASENAP
jgi:hypothetical protein